MFAVIALLIFAFAAFGVQFGTVNMIALGLAALSLHFLLDLWPFPTNPPWRQRPKAP